MAKQKRLDVFVKGNVSDSIKAKYAAKRIMKSLDNAEDNAREKCESAKEELDGLIISLAGSRVETIDDANYIINEISKKIEIREKGEAELKRVQQIKDFLNGEIDCEDK